MEILCRRNIGIINLVVTYMIFVNVILNLIGYCSTKFMKIN